MAQPAPGWCDPSLRKHPIEYFVSQTRIFDTKRSNNDFRGTFQTTPVPLRGTSPPDLRGEPEKDPNSRRQQAAARCRI